MGGGGGGGGGAFDANADGCIGLSGGKDVGRDIGRSELTKFLVGDIDGAEASRCISASNRARC